MSIFEHLEQLLEYGLERKLISIWDREYTRNRLYEALDITHPEPISSTSIKQSQSLPDLLAPIYKWAAETGRMEADTDTYRDLLSAKLMGCFVPAPSEVIRKFEETKALYGPKQATKEFYQYSEDVYYIRTDRIAKNVHWTVPTEYGELEMTINLSKPEKDPKAIAAAKSRNRQIIRCVCCVKKMSGSREA